MGGRPTRKAGLGGHDLSGVWGLLGRSYAGYDQVYRQLKHMRDYNPDAALAVWNFLLLCNQGAKVEVYAELRGARDVLDVPVVKAAVDVLSPLANEVEFQLGNSKRRVAVASRLYTEPGHSFRDPGATLRDDFIVFALDAPPSESGLWSLTPRVRTWMAPGCESSAYPLRFHRTRTTSSARCEQRPTCA